MPKRYGAFTGGVCAIALLGATPAGAAVADLEDLSGQEIADRSKKALDSAESLRLTLEQGGDFPFTMKLALDEDDNCAGSIDRGENGSVELLKRGQVVWMKPDSAFWKHEIGGEQGDLIARLFKNRYIRGTTDDPILAAVAAPCDMAGFRAASEDSEDSPWSKGKQTTVNGQKAMSISRQRDGTRITLFVAAKGKPYPLKVERQDAVQRGSLTISDYDKPVPDRRPSSKESVDVSQLQDHLQQPKEAGEFLP
ncbi:hypothetical protein [Streptomyces gobiensis]|uniref:hypothetical protein n=1 Tax=Streptomyces gobiensis TaxID=2875706 RepID=UPI001E2E7635|nr:hypothetical protein [Streptomyces gobiensis]UGY93242.1 hypothetical protein test1122_16975 [Streptomyces gobiensis]